MNSAHRPQDPSHRLRLYVAVLVLCLSCCVPACSLDEGVQDFDWPVYKADNASTSYSPLGQINRSNVQDLELAWEFRTGDQNLYTIECSPIVIDDVMYLTTPELAILALQASTGELIWRFVPQEHGATRRDGMRVNRGLTYWAENDDRRLFYVAGTRLFAVHAETGKPVASFGEGGSVDFTEGLDRDVSGLPVSATSPGVIYEDLLIIGSSLRDGTGTIPPGHIRAFNVRTGEREWIFHTIPHPGELGYETWPPDAWKTAGGSNSWAGLSLDERRGMVFAPTGSPTYDHYGADRQGQNLFANTILALNARTGERIWHFQAVHHDLWDYDLASPPNLVTVRHDGELLDAVAQVTKIGHMFLLDRETGEPLFAVEERPVPQSELPGELSWPTQPFPQKPPPLTLQRFRAEDITDLTEDAHEHVKKHIFDTFGESVLFQPPSTGGAVYAPQFNGGTDWGGAAFDPETGILYVNTSNEPETLTMLPAHPNASHSYPWVASGHDEVFDNGGFPISKRPWGMLNAVDLNEGSIRWQVPLGTYPDLEALGYPPTGTFNIGGPVVTAGGLVFIGATKDERFRAFDKDTGEVLWEYQLPAGGYATPAVFMVAGRQYIVIGAGGGGKPGTKPGDAYLAFALPQSAY